MVFRPGQSAIIAFLCLALTACNAENELQPLADGAANFVCGCKAEHRWECYRRVTEGTSKTYQALVQGSISMRCSVDEGF